MVYEFNAVDSGIEGIIVELGANLHLMSQFVKARNKLTKNLPKWVAGVVNYLT